jgi:hypothetical protein
MALSGILAGCSLANESFREPSPQLEPLPSRTCVAVAQQHMEDAAVNGYDSATQRVVFNDSYKTCVSLEGRQAPASQSAGQR